MSKLRGFEVVKDAHRKHFEDVTIANKKQRIYYDIQLPVRADPRSAGYDLFLPKDILLHPAQKTLVFLDVKAYMQEDEVLQIYPRSSLGIKKGLMLSNTVGIIDSSYYSNDGNDGNIALALLNTSGKGIELKAGERIAQGVFTKFLVADNDKVLDTSRTGGMGSSGK